MTGVNFATENASWRQLMGNGLTYRVLPSGPGGPRSMPACGGGR